MKYAFLFCMIAALLVSCGSDINNTPTAMPESLTTQTPSPSATPSAIPPTATVDPTSLWNPVFDLSCALGSYDPAKDMLTITNESNSHFLVIGTFSGEIHLDAPLRIHLDSFSSGSPSQGGLIRFHGRKGGGLDIEYYGGQDYGLGFNDSDVPEYKAEIQYLGLSASSPMDIIFDQIEGKSFDVLNANGDTVKHVDLIALGLNVPNGIFPDGYLDIGVGVSSNSTLMIKGLKAGTLPGGAPQAETDTGTGLVDLARRQQLTIGAEMQFGSMADPRYCDTVKKNFDLAIIDTYDPDWWLGPNQYDFTLYDAEVNYAYQHGFRVRLSHLVWGDMTDAIPSWLSQGSFTRDEYISILQQHIRTVMGRYKGKIQEWSIANEATDRALFYGNDFWNNKIGPEYIEIAFRTAREADPNGVLIFNDGENESMHSYRSRQVVDKMYSTIKDLQAKGVTIDIVGMQMEQLKSDPNIADVVQTMQYFASLGVRIDITEFNVDLHNHPGSQQERWQFEAGIYRDMLTACLQSRVCDSFATWGVSDSTTYLTCLDPWCQGEADADPLMFDHDFNPKPAYDAVQDVLTQFTPFKP